MPEINLQLNPDNKSLGFDSNKLCVKISPDSDNGLSIDGNGDVVATKAPDGDPGTGGTMNTPGNALGPSNATATTPLRIIGCNTTVSRHKKYSGSDTFIQDNDGPVMTKLSNQTLVTNASIAAWMITTQTT